MRIASYNIHEGARHSYSPLIAWVRRNDIRVLCLQEADRWHLAERGRRARLEDFAARTGLYHAAFGDSNTASKIITYSRYPISETKVYKQGFHHCAVQTTIEGEDGPFRVLNVHQNPFSPVERYHEARRITRIAKDQGIDIIAGDINHPSRVDNYPPSFYAGLRAQGNVRYGAKKLCHGVTDHYARQGFIDTAAYMGANQPSYPTPLQTDPYHAHVMRLGYIYVTSALAESIKDFEVIKDEQTDWISDHYPSIMTLGPATAAVHTPSVGSPVMAEPALALV